MLRQLYNDYVARLADGRDPRLLELDDKWMFTPAFFAAAARRGHWSECLVYPSHDSVTPLRDETAVNLRLGGDLARMRCRRGPGNDWPITSGRSRHARAGN
jgi:hypothetical protein